MILLEENADPGEHPGSWAVGEGTGFQPVVQQALGVVMATLEVDAEYALARLRGHAFASGRPLSQVAHDVVARRLRLEPDRL